MKNNKTLIFITLSAVFIFWSCSDNKKTTSDPMDDTSITWFRIYGSLEEETGRSVSQTSDGGYILIGTSLIKSNAYGKIMWQKGISGNSVQQTTDGGFIITGSRSGGLGRYVFLSKIDEVGNIKWTNTFSEAFFYEGSCVQQTNDDGFVIVGTSSSQNSDVVDVIMIKTDSNGKELWTKIYGGTDSDLGSYVQQTSDDGYIIVGKTFSFGSGQSDVYLIKTDFNGNELWSRSFGGISYDQGSCVQQTLDGGYIIVGFTGSVEDIYLIKTDENGNESWSQKFGGNSNDTAHSVQQTYDGGYIIAGETRVEIFDDFDVLLIKTDALGNELWSEKYGSTDSDFGYSVQQTSDKGYVLTGQIGRDIYHGTGGDIFLIKTDSNGNIIE